MCIRDRNPLGGNAKPFAPVVLAKLGKPITWDAKSKIGNDSELSATPTEVSGSTTATLAIPEGTVADSIYVQIASTGDSDGSYDSIALAFTPVEVPVEETPPAPAAAGPTTTTTDGCATSGGRQTSGLFAGLLGVGVALAALRRRSTRS